MRLLVGSLVGCVLFLSTLVCSSPAAWASRDLWERDGGDSCVIDVRDHQVTKALVGSKVAYEVSPTSKCEKLCKLIDKSTKPWEAGNHNEAVAVFYQVYSPQADPKEVKLVQKWLNPNLSNQFGKTAASPDS